MTYYGGAGGITAYNGWKITGKKGGSATITFKVAGVTRNIKVTVTGRIGFVEQNDLTNWVHLIPNAEADLTYYIKRDGTRTRFKFYDVEKSGIISGKYTDIDYFTVNSSSNSNFGWTFSGSGTGFWIEFRTLTTVNSGASTVYTFTLHRRGDPNRQTFKIRVMATN